MSEIMIIYWSGTGNTEKMAEYIKEGIEAKGATAICKTVSEASIDDVKNYKTVVFGCPSMGVEVLEEEEMEPFFTEAESHLNGKNVALFGSYGWGDGQWMREWVERTKATGANLVTEEGVMANEEPDDDSKADCQALGEKLAAL